MKENLKPMTDFLEGISKYRSQLMGIAIIWIMLFHSGIDAPDNIVMRALWYIFVSFGGGMGVDLFFILSGFGLVYSASKITERKQWFGWEGKRMVRLLPSYLIVATVFYLLPGQGGVNLYKLLQLNFLCDGIRDFWFIPAIAICYLFFPLIFKLCNRCGYRAGLAVTMLCSIVIYLAVYYLDFDYYKKIEIFLLRVPCFIIGVWLGFLSKEGGRKEFNIMLAVSMVLLAITLFVKYPGSDRWMFSFGTVLLIPILIVLLQILSLKPLQSYLQYFGKRSLQIYLVHVSVGGWLARAIDAPAVSYLVYFAGSVLIAEAIYRITNPINALYNHR